MRFTSPISLILLLIAGCSAQPAQSTATPARPTFNLPTMVQATLEALTTQATPLAIATPASPSPTAPSTPGSISGNLTYPADSMPALYVVAYGVGVNRYQYVI